MAQGFTDFSEYTTGVIPSDWTPRYTAVSGDITVDADAGYTGGKALHMLSSGGAANLLGVSWDDIDALADRDDIELYCRLKLNANDSKHEARLAGRCAGTTIGNADYYAASISAFTDQANLLKRVSGSRTTIDDVAISPPDEVWRHMVVRINGTSLEAYHWADGDSEPATPTLTATDSSISGVGFAGIISGAFATGQVDNILVDLFGYGTGGDAAPRASADVTAPTLSSPTGTQTGATTADLTVSTDEGNGTLYWVVTTSATAPSVAQVQAGQDHTGSAAPGSGNQSVGATGTQNASATGLTAATAYYAHFQQEDAANNDSTVLSSASFTTAAATTQKLRIDELLYTNAAKTTLYADTGHAITVLDRSATRAIVYQADAVAITGGELEITDAAFETADEVFDVVIVKSDTVRGVFPATVVTD